MDTFTQLALGAACGEAALGRKIGNRAMVWSAFGGLLPDFDVAASFFTDEITALAFHRGFMHSITFAMLASLGLGWAVERLYSSGFYRRRGYKGFVLGAVLAFYVLLMFGFRFIFKDAVETWGHFAVAVVGGLALGWFIWKKYFSQELMPVATTRKDWVLLFFVSIFTHPVLDCFTVFGTQLFQPFSDYRVAFNNISVLDPQYTIFLLIGILVASQISREKKARRIANWVGIVLSSAYMTFTFYHKAEFDKIFKASLAKEGIEYQRFMSAPTILNNSLWLGVAEGDTAYYHGYYTFFDKEPTVKTFNVLPKNHELLSGYENDRTFKILKWFSKDYYNVIQRKDGRLQFNDVRYGAFEEGFKDENAYVFKFILEEKDGKLEAEQSREGRKINGDAFSKYMDRVLGR
ncbi:MAG: metal-dependent hydrolase [Saprospiraceae bacterium]|nr:metal-dependent hydrolase [Saprospiraceae bacterium]MCF8249103.1 metal-dependent hydrolase [Saprospiraceae bacterium]MCF8282908.1 metal-dependent hydrolase [Bacteroidales bacterium]MCF8311125.1 metal-dependent hydrolase [Saprospiraceae bacterium]MCF8440215.1 metal-dependent hydrolase [Saprospiraceae bacterium]